MFAVLLFPVLFFGFTAWVGYLTVLCFIANELYIEDCDWNVGLADKVRFWTHSTFPTTELTRQVEMNR
jgi:hypothetical protein